MIKKSMRQLLERWRHAYPSLQNRFLRHKPLRSCRPRMMKLSWNCHESPRAQSHSSCHFQDTENHHKTMFALHRGSLQSHGSVWPNLLTWWHCMNPIHRPTLTKQSHINNFQCSSVANNIQWKLADFTNEYQKSSKINRNKRIILNPH